MRIWLTAARKREGGRSMHWEEIVYQLHGQLHMPSRKGKLFGSNLVQPAFVAGLARTFKNSFLYSCCRRPADSVITRDFHKNVLSELVINPLFWVNCAHSERRG